MAALNNFYVGQSVLEWAFLWTRYGVVRDIDYNTGKVKVYWNYAEDSKGNEMDIFTAKIYASLYSETWVNADSLSPLY